MAASITIGKEEIARGERKSIRIPLPRLYTHEETSMTVQAVCGKASGKNLFLCATLHGDELNGIEIIRRVMEKLDPERVRGTVIAAPVINVFGLINQSRYLPDRRDLNRAFPGSAKGSLAARLAHIVMNEIVQHCSHGIDLHTGSNDRINLPQIRGDLTGAETRRCAEAFGAPIMLHLTTRDGSLREAATAEGKHVLVYEAGEALRFNADAIDIGVRGVVNVMKALGMLKGKRSQRLRTSVLVESLGWMRAKQSGFLSLEAGLGRIVAKGQSIGAIQDPFGQTQSAVRVPHDGIVISHTQSPLVHRGDAIVHLARARSAENGTPSLSAALRGERGATPTS
jgi:hypothetical protein